MKFANAARFAGLFTLCALAVAGEAQEATLPVADKQGGKSTIGTKVVDLVNKTIRGHLDVGVVDIALPHTVILRDVALNDPQGARVASVDRVELVVELKALVQRELHVTALHIDGPRLTLRQRGDTVNLVEALAPRQPKPEEKDDDKPAKGRAVIDDVVVKGAVVDFADGKGVSAHVEGVDVVASADVDLESEARVVVVRGLKATRGVVHKDDVELPLADLHVATVDLKNNDVVVGGVTVRVAGVGASAAGRIGLTGNQDLDVKASIKAPGDLKIKGVALPFATPPLDADVVVKGTVKAPRVSARGGFGAFAPEDVRVDGGSFSVVADSARVVVESVVAALGDARVRGHGSYAIDSGDVVFDVDSDAIAVARVAAPLHIEPAPRGTVTLKANVKGATQGKDALYVDAHVGGSVVDADVKGGVYVEPKRLDLGVHARFRDLESFVPALGEDASVGNGRVDVVVVGAFDDPRVKGTAGLESAAAQGVQLRDFGAAFDASKHRVVVSALHGRVAEGILTGTADAWLEGKKAVTGKLQLVGFDLASLRGPLAGSAGKGTVVVDLSGTGDDPRAAATVDAHRVVVKEELVGEVAVAATASKQRVEVTKLAVNGVLAQVSSPGLSLDLQSKALDGRVVVDRLLLGKLRAARGAGVAGNVTGEVVVGGTTDAPDVAVALDLQQLSARGGALGGGPIRAHLTGDKVLTASVHLAVDSEGLAHAVTQASAQAQRDRDGARDADDDARKLANAVAAGDGDAQHGGAPKNANQPKNQPTSAPTTANASKNAKASRAQSPNAAQAGQARIDVDATVDLDHELVDAHASLADVALLPWLALAPASVERIDGALSGDVVAKGRWRAPEVTLRLTSPALTTVGGVGRPATALGPLDVDASLRAGALLAKVRAFDDRVQADARGTLDLDAQDVAVDVDAFIDLPQIEELVPALRDADTALGAKTKIAARVVKDKERDAVVDVRAALQALTLHKEGAPPLSLAAPVDISFVDGVLRVPASAPSSGSGAQPGLSIVSSDKKVKLNARAVASADDVDAHLDGGFPLVLAKALSSAIANATGTANVDLDVKGSPKRGLLVSGSATPRPESSLTPRSTGQRVTFLGGAVRFAPGAGAADVRVALDDLRVEVGGGEATATGSVDVHLAPLAGDGATATAPDAPPETQTAQAPQTAPQTTRTTTAAGAALTTPAGATSTTTPAAAAPLVRRWDLRANGDGLYVRQGDVGVDVGFDLSLVGDAPAPLLKGTLTVADGDFRKKFALQDFVVAAEEPGSSAPLDQTLRPIGLDGLRLDVDVSVRDFRARAELPAFSLDALLRGDVSVRDTVVAPRVAGAFGVEEGEINFPRARFEITDLQAELPTGAPGTSTSPTLFLTAHADVPPGAAGNDTTLPIDLLLDGPIDSMNLDLTATGGGHPYTRADLLSVVLFGKPLRDFGGGGGEGRGAMGLVAGQASSVLTQQLADRIEQRFGGQLELNLIADETDSNDPRFAAGWRWKVGRRVDLEGVAGLGNATSTSASTTTQAGTDAARLRLLVFDHLPIGQELAFEGRLARNAAEPGAAASGELRLGFRWFEGRTALFTKLLSGHEDSAAAAVVAAGENDERAPRLRRVDADVGGGAAATKTLDESRVSDSLAGLLGRPLGGVPAPPPAKMRYRIVDEAESRLRALGRYRDVACAVVEPPAGGVLRCSVKKARVIRDITVSGLALGLLEADVRHRLSLRSGDSLDAIDDDGNAAAPGQQTGPTTSPGSLDGDEAKKTSAEKLAQTGQRNDADAGRAADALGKANPLRQTANDKKTQLQRQAQALVDYFEREGFHGAHVEVKEVVDEADPSVVDLAVVVEGGAFVHVGDVDVVVRGDRGRKDEVDKDDVAGRFRHMCFAPDSVVDAVFAGGLDCYSKKRVRERAERLEQEMRDAGHKEARVRVVPTWVGDDVVDLKVTVRRGPKVTTAIRVVDGADSGVDVVDLPDTFTGALLFARRSLWEPIGRLFGGQPDDDVIVEDLAEQETFDAARASDEAEAAVSAAAMQERLARRGHKDAVVKAEHHYEENGDVSVDFVVVADRSVIVDAVAVEGAGDEFGEDGKDLIEEAELRTQPRGLFSSGFVADDAAEKDEEALRRVLQAHGYAEAAVSHRVIELDEKDDGTARSAVLFDVVRGAQYVVKSLEVHGDPELEPEVLKVLSSCRAAPRAKKVAKMSVDDCKDGPVVVDEIGADEDRVRALYAARGYPRTVALLEHAFDDDGVRLRLTVKPQQEKPPAEQPAEQPAASTAPNAPETTTPSATTNAATTNALTTNAATTNATTTNAWTTNALTTNALTTNAPMTNALTTNAATTNATTNATTTNAITTNAATTNALTTNAATTDAATTTDAPTPPQPPQEKETKLEKAILGEVYLQGNSTTRGGVLRRELGVDDKEGTPLDPLAIQKGVSRLRRTGLYSRVDLDYVGLDMAGVPVDVTLQVEEKPSFTVDSSVGFSTEKLFQLGLQIDEKNLFGSMIDAGFLLDWGLFIGRQSQLRLPVRWPRINGTDLSATFTPFASYRDESSGVSLVADDPVKGTGEDLLGTGPRRRLFAAGAAVSFDYAVNQLTVFEPDKLTVGLAYELRSEWVNLDADPIDVFSEENLRTVSGLTDPFAVAPARIASLTPRILYSDIDNPFDPLEGLSAELLFKASSPLWLSQDTFGVLGFSGTAYTTFSERFTLASRLSLRQGFVADDPPCGDCGWALMQNDLYLLGGERSVRGYGENTIGVTGPLFTPNLTPVDAVAPRQGLFGAQASLELRMLLVKNLGIGDLKPAVFVDAGVVTDDARDAFAFADRIADDEFGMSVGAGLRYVMPVGPALFDCAISPVATTPGGAPIARCHLALGYTF